VLRFNIKVLNCFKKICKFYSIGVFDPNPFPLKIF
jgi:hypothetical protein